ncbi:MAG TPA: hypothetical protein DCQ98_22335 [Planctomycetaceae bacterium]|nr:hypothetical protein [Planctomycetaceae bacterium]HRF01910.1 OmpH family outer membrane protein [Pirellulaceae bacterium]
MVRTMRRFGERRWLPIALLALIAIPAIRWGFDRVEAGAAAPWSTAPGAVAVVDVIEIARQLGVRERLQGELDARQAELNGRLELLQRDYAQRLEERRAALGQPASESQQRELEQFTLSLNSQILQERNAAKVEYAAYQAELESKFADQVRPIALETARQAGYSLVMARANVFAVSPEADVTTAVIETMRKMPEFSAPTGSAPRPRVGAAQRGGGEFRPNDR